MPRTIKSYTLKELSNENEAILLEMPNGDQIMLENFPMGSGISLLTPGKIKKIGDFSHYIIKK